MAWTKEQQEAIDYEGENIIVSAGAGSGKTAVLTARTLRKLQQGVHVDQLLILTFTKAAAFEMMMRIRKSIISNDLKDELDRIDKAYITTFDSYALSIVKRYHHVLNISKNVSIIDSNIIGIEKRKIIDEIFERLYNEENPKFLKLIGDFSIKDDREIRDFIYKLNNTLDMRYDKVAYLNNYVKNYYSDDSINDIMVKYNSYLKEKIDSINNTFQDLSSYIDEDYYEKVYGVLKDLFGCTTYDDIKNVGDIKLPAVPRNSEDEVKTLKTLLATKIKELLDVCTYDCEREIIESIKSTKDYVTIIIEIILELDMKIYNYKFKIDNYEFVDISKMAITIVKNYKEIREELKASFNEIMIDEYQDTNDLQEEFIKYIANDNVYMVGDIKQSIYRFRNANPQIFKEKYNNYNEHNGGHKIDLVKNFRSRFEVLDDINYIFDRIMDLDIGGAAYQEQHRMVFGNNTYIEEGKTNQNNNMEVCNYQKDSSKKFKEEEIEATIIAKDIIEKVESKYLVFDKDTKILRPIEYKDFVILLDRSKQFSLYKKIFEYFKIPLTISRDESITKDINIHIINNILKLIICLKEKRLDDEFKMCFLSVARSFLFRMFDEEIFDVLETGSYYDTDIVKSALKIVDILEVTSLDNIIKKILYEFNFYEKLITIGDIENTITRLEYIAKLAGNMAEAGYNVYDFSKYFEIMLKDYDIKFSLNTEAGNSVSIMTIHKSKGLEFPICYYSMLNVKFNKADIKDRFVYDNKYGIITPYFNEGIGTLITKTLLKNDYLREEISEEIRLFYVALTRAKEKMIIVLSLNDEATKSRDEHNVVVKEERMKYDSFKKVLDSICIDLKSYTKNIDINNIGLTKDYLINKKTDIKSLIGDNDFVIEEVSLDISNTVVDSTSFSKKIKTIIDSDTFENLKFGKYMHYLFEVIDFKNPEIDTLNISDFYKNKLKLFLESDLLKNVSNANIYKEYEFLDNRDGNNNHGIIDLMLEYDDYVDIIDYKLKEIDDKTYYEQLSGYRDYIVFKTGKKVNIYLYSIMNGKYEKL